MFRDKFWLSLALTLPVVFWSSEVQHWLGYSAPTFPGSRLIPAILGSIIFVYGGSVFIHGAWRELSNRQPGMMTLISLAIVVICRFYRCDSWCFRSRRLVGTRNADQRHASRSLA
jgi:Cu2+-exporting ATPase